MTFGLAVTQPIVKKVAGRQTARFSSRPETLR
jgi:hypothetical protein